MHSGLAGERRRTPLSREINETPHSGPPACPRSIPRHLLSVWDLEARGQGGQFQPGGLGPLGALQEQPSLLITAPLGSGYRNPSCGFHRFGSASWTLCLLA